MTTIQSIDFLPPATAELHILRVVGGVSYRPTLPLDLGSLPAEAQAVIAAAAEFLSSHLPEGYVPDRIPLTRLPGGILAVWSTPLPDDDPETFIPEEITPAFDDILGSVLGSHPAHGPVAIPQGQIILPPEIRIALLQVWGGVEATLNP